MSVWSGEQADEINLTTTTEENRGIARSLRNYLNEIKKTSSPVSSQFYAKESSRKDNYLSRSARIPISGEKKSAFADKTRVRRKDAAESNIFSN